MGFSVKKLLKKAKKYVVGAVVGSALGVGAAIGAAATLLVNHSSSKSNTNTGSVTTTNNDVNIYIPETVLSFEGELFKPNTRLYAFFDGKDVTSYITPDGESQGSPLISDSAGHVKGTLLIPNDSTLKFIQGKKELKFTDVEDNLITKWIEE